MGGGADTSERSVLSDNRGLAVFRDRFSHNLALTFSCLVGSVLLAQPPAVPTSLDEAAAAYTEGKTAEAARILETVLKADPTDPSALVLMGVVLDTEQRYSDADAYYQRALTVAPGSPQVLNNAANHYLIIGNRNRARDLYLKTIAIEPSHLNANLQLAQISVDDKQGGEALVYLGRMGDEASSDSGGLLLRARAFALSSRCSEAGEILRKFEGLPSGDERQYFSVGMAQAECKLYGVAEISFSRALDADPRNFDILYNLGLAALRAGHTDRAQSVLETALRERPDDADALYTLAQNCREQQRPVAAAALLAKAQKAEPNRADIALLIAQVAAQLEFHEDSAVAYDRYLKLKPEDDAARRERGFNLARAHQSKSAMRDLEWYVARHPTDAVGYFELAVAQTFDDRGKALDSLNQAIVLDPALNAARYTRALLNIEEENPAAAVPDLQLFLEKQPRDHRALARLGQAYLALNRVNDAAEVLERARVLAPDSPLVLVQYRRAMIKLGRRQEATAVLAHLKETGNTGTAKRRAGLMDYLSLSPEEQHARYLANLRANGAADPGDIHLRIRLARELLAEQKTGEALHIFRQLKSDALNPALLADCGRILLEFDQFEPASRFLESAVAAAPTFSAARLDLALVLFHLQTAAVALVELDKIPDADRNGDYYLLRAQILDAQGKVEEAGSALNLGIRAAPTKPSLYYQATSFLLKHRLYHEAQSLLERASRILPDDRDLLLAQVITLDLLSQNIDSERLLARIQARWPEWDHPYLLKGILLEIQLKSAEARQTLETAIALGANTPEAYYYQALAITHSAPQDLDAAQTAIARAMSLTSRDPYIYLLAGKISLARKEYPAAIERLLQATRLHPTLIPAHYALRDAYKALGDERKSSAELEAIKHIASETAGSDQSPFSMEDFLFSVRPPG